MREFLKEPNRLGMVLFLLSEIGFFGILLSSFIYFSAGTTNAGPNVTSLDIQRTAIFTLFLFASSLTIWLASRSLKRGSRSGMTFWLAVTVVFGAIFLIGQLTEYMTLINDNVTINRDIFGTTFFTITGFHGLHVFMGLVMITILVGLSASGIFKPPESTAVETISLYWHFVDLVWVFVFSICYIIPAIQVGMKLL